MSDLKELRDALSAWADEMFFAAGSDTHEDGTPKMGKFESEQLFRVARQCLDNGSLDFALTKRPVMWRVKDYADGWIPFHNEEAAINASEVMGALLQGLYVRDGLSPTERLSPMERIAIESTERAGNIEVRKRIYDDSPAIEWFKVEDFEPPQKTLLMVTGDSGYATHKKFLELAYIDEEYRPSKRGSRSWDEVVNDPLWDIMWLRWQSVVDDPLSDKGWYPTHWAWPINLPEILP